MLVAVPEEILLPTSIELGTQKKRGEYQMFTGKAINRCFHQEEWKKKLEKQSSDQYVSEKSKGYRERGLDRLCVCH